MSQLEGLIPDPDNHLPTLIRAGLIHVQFEAIRPFLDGNGRLGRLLITLLLCVQGVLRSPMLYLSLFLKKHRTLYYELLQTVRQTVDWERRLDFSLEGVTETADQAADTARKLIGLFDADRRRIDALGRPASSALRVHHHLQQRPLMRSVRLCSCSAYRSRQ